MPLEELEAAPLPELQALLGRIVVDAGDLQDREEIIRLLRSSSL